MTVPISFSCHLQLYHPCWQLHLDKWSYQLPPDFSHSMWLLHFMSGVSLLLCSGIDLESSNPCNGVLNTVSLCICCQLLDIRALSLEKSRSSSLLVNFHRMLVLLYVVALLMVQSITRRNRNPDMIHHYFTPDFFKSTLGLHSRFTLTIHGFDNSYNLWWNSVSSHDLS